MRAPQKPRLPPIGGYLSVKDLILLPPRGQDSHKGQNGTVLVIGGSERYAGAPYFAAMAALRSGVDLVRVASPAQSATIIAGYSPDLIMIPLDGPHLSSKHVPALKALIAQHDVTLIGNGLGDHPDTLKAIEALCREPGRFVIDADAFKAVKSASLKGAILTPHRHELAHLLQGNKTDVASIAKENCVIVKGQVDKIHLGTELFQNTTGNTRMTIGGTGDCLAGLCAGLYAQSKDLRTAGIDATYLNGMVGDLAFKKLGFGFVASDMLDIIPEALKSLGLHRVSP